jgi:hypothetical protein
VEVELAQQRPDRLVLLLEQNDEWLVGRRYLSETSMTRVLATTDPASNPHQEVPQLATT